MSPISTETLFHFTSSTGILESILVHELRAHYSLEEIGLLVGSTSWSMAFPMVSFCDIPLSQVARHMQTYGRYGIGLSKPWALRRGISPVLYTHPNSRATQSLDALLTSTLGVAAGRTLGGADDPDLGPHQSIVLTLLKSYEGPFVRPGKPVQYVRFYDEREWRWVPDTVDKVPVLSADDYADFTILKEANTSVWDSGRLSFEPTDIKYIVVAREEEILPMIRAIERIKASYSENEKKLLCSRVVSAEQIEADF